MNRTAFWEYFNEVDTQSQLILTVNNGKQVLIKEHLGLKLYLYAVHDKFVEVCYSEKRKIVKGISLLSNDEDDLEKYLNNLKI